VCVCEWRGEFNRVVLVVQLGLIFHFILNPEQRRVFQLVSRYLRTKIYSEQHNYINCDAATHYTISFLYSILLGAVVAQSA
jgi:hypothetical protein